MFWWRLANDMYVRGNKADKRAARKINTRLKIKYATDIEFGARFGKGLKIPHHTGIVVSHIVQAGENLCLRQNTTIGKKYRHAENARIVIGNNVEIGANCCIIAGDITIGDNVTIAAMSFVMTSIPSDSTYYTVKQSNIVRKN